MNSASPPPTELVDPQLVANLPEAGVRARDMTRICEARADEEAQGLRDVEAVKQLKALCGRYADQGDLTPGAYIAGLRGELREVLADGAGRSRGFGWSLIGDVAMRPTAWAIAGVAERDTLVSIFGDPGAGKSFLAVDWACCMAAGIPWQGRAVCRGLVLFIAGEGRNGLKRRFVAWGVQNGVDANRLPVALSTTAASLCDPEGLGPVLTSIEDIAQAHGAPVAIFIDTLARNFGPGNEDSTQDMTSFVAAADRLRELFGSLVVLVHHSGHGDKGRSRGNSALRGALDAEYRLKKAGAAVVLECLKAKDHDPPEEIALCIRPVELPGVGEDGEPETSAVVVAADPGQDERGDAGCLVDVLRLLDDGHQQKDIAGTLGVHPATVCRLRKKAIQDGLLSRKNKLTPTGFEMVEKDKCY